MFKKIKNIFTKKSNLKQEEIIITIHGFGVRRENEMDDFVAYGNSILPPIKTFNMFDIEDENDDDYTKWIERCENVLLEAIHENKKIYLLGFSMGGVIASYLASKYKIEKLILISPAFIHFNLENYTNIALKTGKKFLSGKEEKKKEMPKSFYNGFISCIKTHKNDISKVTCPVLFIQGNDDEIIPTRSSEWGYEQVPHENKKCIFLHKGKHRILSDEHVKDVAFALINDYIHDTILPIKNNGD